MYVLDINVVLYYLSGDDDVVSIISKIEETGAIVYIPTVVRLELLSKSDITQKEYIAITEFLSPIRQIDLDISIADLSADIRREYKIKTPDSIIAGSALFTNSILLTRNIKDFSVIKELRLQKV